jgi:membrane protein DedA with SNARE-associated domain
MTIGDFYWVGILFTMGFVFGDVEGREDSLFNALLSMCLCLLFPFYWGLTLALLIKENRAKESEKRN